MIGKLQNRELVVMFAVVSGLGSAAVGRTVHGSVPGDAVSVSDTLPAPARVPSPPDSVPGGVAPVKVIADTVLFPEVHGSNLEGRKFTLPADFEGDLNLVFIAFQREQQALVDTWVPFVKDLAVRHSGLRYYELPTIHETNSVVRWFINNGMRRGIPDVSAREATITLYLDKERFREALQLPHEDTIYALLVDAEGRVVWRADGAYKGDHGAAIEQMVAERLSTR